MLTLSDKLKQRDELLSMLQRLLPELSQACQWDDAAVRVELHEIMREAQCLVDKCEGG